MSCLLQTGAENFLRGLLGQTRAWWFGAEVDHKAANLPHVLQALTQKCW